MKTVLTGITTTGAPHLGNYAGAIKPAIEASWNPETRSFYFLADFHALIKCQDPQQIHHSTLEIASTWLAFGLDPERVYFYRQSDIPEIAELTWYLGCVTAKGLMNRAHAYKASVQKNLENHEDPDHAVTMGLFSYPVLMAADILMFKANEVPVGRDQIQHVEMARDIAQRFNHIYGNHLTLPKAVVNHDTPVLQGLDGQKMSKSYHNTIPLFVPEKQLRKKINQIKTNLKEPGEPKDPDSATVFQIWKAFASPQQTEYMRKEFENGIAWGEAKKQLFELINTELKAPRERYHELIRQPDHVEQILRDGAQKARHYSQTLVTDLRHAIGIRRLS